MCSEQRLPVRCGKDNSRGAVGLVYGYLRDRLGAGELHPGDTLDTPRGMASVLGIEPEDLRIALSELDQAGVIAWTGAESDAPVIEVGSAGSISGALNDLLMLNAISLPDLFEARILILEMVLDVACGKLRKPDLSRLAELVQDIRATGRAENEKLRNDNSRRFYHELALLTGNSALVVAVDAHTDVILKLMSYRGYRIPTQMLTASRAVFLRLLQAGELDAAKLELRAHLGKVHAALA